MSKRLFYALFLAIVLTGTLGVSLNACGDKFLVPSRGSRSQRPGTAPEHAAILLYDSGSDFRKGLPNVSAKDMLTKAGYRPTVVASYPELERELRSGHWDAILIGIADAPSLSTQVRATTHRPVIVPMTYNATDAQMRDTRKLYAVVMRFPAKETAFLNALDKALKSTTIEVHLIADNR